MIPNGPGQSPRSRIEQGRHPHAGGPDHYAAYLASTDNYEVELVAAEP